MWIIISHSCRCTFALPCHVSNSYQLYVVITHTDYLFFLIVYCFYQMPAHDRNSPDFKVNERAVEFQKARYEESLAAVQEEEPNLPIVEQRKLAAKKVRWNKQSFQRGNPNVKGDRFYLKALHALCVEEDVGEVCSDMTYEDWKERFKVNDKKLDNWSRIARQDLLWGVVQATNSQNKKLGELTIRQIDQTALGKAITTFEKREGLCKSFERIEFSVEALTFLKTIRDRTSPTIPSMPGSISHLYANNKREATHCGLIDFESNQVLLKLTRGVNLNIDGKTLLNMKKKDIEEAVTDYMSSTFPKLSKKSREFKLQWGLRCITIKWCKHTLRWMISRFEKKACCLLGRIVDTTNLDTSILDTIETIQKIPTQSTTTSTARRRSSTRRKSATSLSSLELKAAFFPVRPLIFPLIFSYPFLIFFSFYTGSGKARICAKETLYRYGEQKLLRCLY